MKLQEVAQQVQMTKRAIKYYEEKGLLQVETVIADIPKSI